MGCIELDWGGGYVKSKVYISEVTSLQQLKRKNIGSQTNIYPMWVMRLSQRWWFKSRSSGLWRRVVLCCVVLCCVVLRCVVLCCVVLCCVALRCVVLCCVVLCCVVLCCVVLCCVVLCCAVLCCVVLCCVVLCCDKIPTFQSTLLPPSSPWRRKTSLNLMHLLKIHWSAHGKSWITGWMYVALQMEFIEKYAVRTGSNEHGKIIQTISRYSAGLWAEQSGF
jgi:hypothetical protein